MKRSIIVVATLLVVTSIVVAACLASYALGGVKGMVMLKEYERGVHEVVAVVDELAAVGRTNDIHEVCQNFQGFYMMKPSDVTNLDLVIEDAENRVSKQPFTRFKK